jgi:hypothetical protein
MRGKLAALAAVPVLAGCQLVAGIEDRTAEDDDLDGAPNLDAISIADSKGAGPNDVSSERRAADPTNPPNPDGRASPDGGVATDGSVPSPDGNQPPDSSGPLVDGANPAVDGNAPPADANPARDGAERDIEPPLPSDASGNDALADASSVDTHTEDAPPDLAGAPVDSGVVDTAVVDTVVVDTAVADTVVVDTTVVDTGVSCDLDAGKSPTDNPCLIHERYGVFVAPTGSDSTGTGTRSAPFRSIGRGLLAAKQDTMRVFACDNGTGYVDGATVDATLDGVAAFGGFDCSAWTVSATARSRIHPDSGPALRLNGVSLGVSFEGFELQSANAALGASSIGVILDGANNVVFKNVRIVAGNGGAGPTGLLGIPGQDGTAAGAGQNGTNAECVGIPGDRPGGSWASATTCGSRGGTALPSNSFPDQQAESGVPQEGVSPTPNYNGGGGFLGLPAGPGSPGNPGALGVPTASVGVFAASGYTPEAPAGSGADGNTGQGGGGAVSGGTDNPAVCNVATGGAGGMGGCGGKAGQGGGSGGASVGILSWQSTLTLDACQIVSGTGGSGGAGGLGGAGGKGMPGGKGGAPAASGGATAAAGPNGGTGGDGGVGGSGAGGNGGPSHGLVFRGTRPSTVNGSTITPGGGGAAGIGGSAGGQKAGDGKAGTSSAELLT